MFENRHLSLDYVRTCKIYGNKVQEAETKVSSGRTTSICHICFNWSIAIGRTPSCRIYKVAPAFVAKHAYCKP